jgi:hypothetical protein
MIHYLVDLVPAYTMWDILAWFAWGMGSVAVTIFVFLALSTRRSPLAEKLLSSGPRLPFPMETDHDQTDPRPGRPTHSQRPASAPADRGHAGG